MPFTTRISSLSALCLLGMTTVSAESITVAVASNFSTTVPEITAHFEEKTGYSVQVIVASTGKLHIQISNGAPFDVLLAADIERPRLLEISGHGVVGSRFTYAIGRLVLWSRDPTLTGTDGCRRLLENLQQKRLAIANPDTAPYGAAAKEALISLDLWDRVSPRLVVGESIGQTLHFAASGSASLGFIAATQSLIARLPQATCIWPVPSELHRPIEQQAILLQRAANNTVAVNFMAFLRGTDGRAIIRRHGYTVPTESRDQQE